MTPQLASADLCWADAVLAVELLAVDPAALGGLLVRSGPGPQRDRLVAWVQEALPAGAPVMRVPLHVTEDRLLGGLSLAATLHAGRLIAERGLLAQADGGVLVVAMAERLEQGVTAHLCSALDRGELTVERDGLTTPARARFGVLALDEGLGEERPPASLRDRLALQLDFSALDPRAEPEGSPDPARIALGRHLAGLVGISAPMMEALCQAAVALGVGSLRGALQACAVARTLAALAGRVDVEEADVTAAARLVLGPRATRMPQPVPEDEDEDESPSQPEDEQTPEDERPEPKEDRPDEDSRDHFRSDAPLEELVLEAAKSAIPAGLLELLALGREPRSSQRSAGHSGAVRASTSGGRPAGTRSGMPRAGERLNVVETLRAAAPWQPLRRRERGLRSGGAPAGRLVEIRKDDFRVTRFKQHTETSVIFAVDASGSAALQRLAEAKGAVEQVLLDCYVRRDHVALIAFRGAEASLLLPSTRSLARVRRCLAQLAGGGTTPLAAGIDAALGLAVDARRLGRTPVLVLMTDGRGNVARDGREGSAVASVDATASARAVREAGVRALFLDTAPRPRPQAQALAKEMGARYLPLPYLDAVGISAQVQNLSESPR